MALNITHTRHAYHYILVQWIVCHNICPNGVPSDFGIFHEEIMLIKLKIIFLLVVFVYPISSVISNANINITDLKKMMNNMEIISFNNLLI